MKLWIVLSCPDSWGPARAAWGATADEAARVAMPFLCEDGGHGEGSVCVEAHEPRDPKHGLAPLKEGPHVDNRLEAKRAAGLSCDEERYCTGCDLGDPTDGERPEWDICADCAECGECSRHEDCESWEHPWATLEGRVVT